MNPLSHERRRPTITTGSNDGGWQRRHRPDYALIVISALLLVIGLVVVFSISPALGAQKNVGDSYFVNKQIIAIILGIISFMAA